MKTELTKYQIALDRIEAAKKEIELAIDQDLQVEELVIALAACYAAERAVKAVAS